MTQPMSNSYCTVNLRDIVMPKERQRATLGDIESLAESINRLGMINPVTITREKVLVAGERRVRAMEYLLKNGQILDADCPVPCQYADELDEYTRTCIEYEENIKRANLTWKEDALAVYRYYTLRQLKEPEFGLDECGDEIGLHRTSVARRVAVAKALEDKDPQVSSCVTLKAAFNVVERRRSRAIDEEVEGLFDTASSIDIEGDDLDSELDGAFGEGDEEDPMAGFSAEEHISEDLPRMWYGSKKQQYRSGADDITCEDFNEFVKTYSGPRFNLIHCDFPYGVGMHKSDQAAAAEHNTYEDSEETFFKLLGSFLRHKDDLVAENAHVVFWYAMKYYTVLVEAFENKGFKVNPYPLIWYKSDNKGILPDAKRGPRRCYETALLISNGDRHVVQAVPNAVEFKTPSKGEHFTQKPFLVLQHFFRMLVDKSTVVLDPTCGSGTALCVAEALHAKSVRGMDIDEAWTRLSIRRLNESRLAKALPESNE